MYYTLIESPIDSLLLTGNGRYLTGIYMDGDACLRALRQPGDEKPEMFAQAIEQLDAYFAGQLQDFDLPLEPSGTAFQKQVWRALRQIPYGQTTSYKAIAEAVGAPRAVRAVGSANGRNPLPVVVPCHRVVGANGKLTGYSGGLGRKEWLLAHEACQGELLR